MKIVIDMNLSPAWVAYFNKFGFESVHWTQVGEIRASDEEIFQWAKNNDYIIITQDLDFSAILALSNSEKPSVILIRAKNSLPENIGTQLIEILKIYSSELETGAHVVLDSISSRIRILPLN
jgi:predicted nuclease of predicted toxin-antitoxin system